MKNRMEEIEEQTGESSGSNNQPPELFDVLEELQELEKLKRIRIKLKEMDNSADLSVYGLSNNKYGWEALRKNQKKNSEKIIELESRAELRIKSLQEGLTDFAKRSDRLLKDFSKIKSVPNWKRALKSKGAWTIFALSNLVSGYTGYNYGATSSSGEITQLKNNLNNSLIIGANENGKPIFTNQSHSWIELNASFHPEFFQNFEKEVLNQPKTNFEVGGDIGDYLKNDTSVTENNNQTTPENRNAELVRLENLLVENFEERVRLIANQRPIDLPLNWKSELKRIKKLEKKIKKLKIKNQLRLPQAEISTITASPQTIGYTETDTTTKIVTTTATITNTVIEPSIIVNQTRVKELETELVEKGRHWDQTFTQHNQTLTKLENERNQLQDQITEKDTGIKELKNNQKPLDLPRDWKNKLAQIPELEKKISELNKRPTQKLHEETLEKLSKFKVKLTNLKEQLDARPKITQSRYEELLNKETTLTNRPPITLTEWEEDYSLRPTQQDLTDKQTEIQRITELWQQSEIQEGKLTTEIQKLTTQLNQLNTDLLTQKDRFRLEIEKLKSQRDRRPNISHLKYQQLLNEKKNIIQDKQNLITDLAIISQSFTDYRAEAQQTIATKETKIKELGIEQQNNQDELTKINSENKRLKSFFNHQPEQKEVSLYWGAERDKFKSESETYQEKYNHLIEQQKGFNKYLQWEFDQWEQNHWEELQAKANQIYVLENEVESRDTKIENLEWKLSKSEKEARTQRELWVDMFEKWDKDYFERKTPSIVRRILTAGGQQTFNKTLRKAPIEGTIFLTLLYKFIWKNKGKVAAALKNEVVRSTQLFQQKEQENINLRAMHNNVQIERDQLTIEKEAILTQKDEAWTKVKKLETEINSHSCEVKHCSPEYHEQLAKNREKEIVEKLIAELELSTDQERENVLEQVIQEIKIKINPDNPPIDNTRKFAEKDRKIADLEEKMENLQKDFLKQKPQESFIEELLKLSKQLNIIEEDKVIEEELKNSNTYQELLVKQVARSSSAMESKLDMVNSQLSSERDKKKTLKTLNWVLGGLSVGSLLAILWNLMKSPKRITE